MAVRWIKKVGLAVTREGRLLVVRKRGVDVFILPGGKPEGEESDLQTLAREIDEELGCGIAKPFLRGVFKDIAAGASNSVVVVRLYSAELVGEPHPQSEIEEIAWVDLRASPKLALAPSIANRILPFLKNRDRRLSNSARQIEHETMQGLFEVA